ncbi:hypothetical protein GX441_03240 [bacterium]|nr:hypothetical protein [bacterium]
MSKNFGKLILIGIVFGAIAVLAIPLYASPAPSVTVQDAGPSFIAEDDTTFSGPPTPPQPNPEPPPPPRL